MGMSLLLSTTPHSGSLVLGMLIVVVHDVPSVCGTKSGAAKLELLCWPPAATAVHPVTLLELDHFGEVGKLRRDVDRL